jgi:SAM-dependent methyltransferase
VQTITFFDKAYGGHQRYWWRDKDRYALDGESYPYSLLTQMTLRLLEERPPGRALDLGSGEGADAIRLALLGYEVDAVDLSPVATAKTARFAEEAGVVINAITADICDFDPPHTYDVVICNGVLHYINDKQSTIERMQASTEKNGLNIISLWSTYTKLPSCHDIVPVFCDDEEGVVKKLYSDWRSEFIYYERDKLETAHSDLVAHRHSHIKLIARKITSD